MEEFNNKVKELLQFQDHLRSDEWRLICHAMFLYYESKLKFEKLYNIEYSLKK